MKRQTERKEKKEKAQTEDRTKTTKKGRQEIRVRDKEDGGGGGYILSREVWRPPPVNTRGLIGGFSGILQVISGEEKALCLSLVPSMNSSFR